MLAGCPHRVVGQPVLHRLRAPDRTAERLAGLCVLDRAVQQVLHAPDGVGVSALPPVWRQETQAGAQTKPGTQNQPNAGAQPHRP